MHIRAEKCTTANSNAISAKQCRDIHISAEKSKPVYITSEMPKTVQISKKKTEKVKTIQNCNVVHSREKKFRAV